MIRLLVGTNTQRVNVIVNTDDTLAEVLDQNHVDISHAALTLNGTQIPGVDKDKTFGELGIDDESSAMLIAVVKADSAQ